MDNVILGVLIAMPLIIGLFMEVYKKTIRKNKAHTLEIYLVALTLSIATTLSGYFGFEFQGKVASIFIYFFYTFTGQFFVSMEGVKRVLQIIARIRGIKIDGFDFNE